MKQIPLTKGLVALVNDEDYEYLMQWRWKTMKHGRTFYAVRSTYKDKKQELISMHRLILDLSKSNEYADHIDRNGLNNQRYNLRISSPTQNSANRSSHKNGTSKYLGVSYRKDNNKWRASICKNGKIINLGQYTTEESAALSYNNNAIELHGNFANLNNIQSH